MRPRICRNTEIFEKNEKNACQKKGTHRFTESFDHTANVRQLAVVRLEREFHWDPVDIELGHRKPRVIFQLSPSSFVPKTGFPYGVSGVFYPRIVLSNVSSSFSSLLFNVVMKHEHSTRMQFGIFFLICAAFRTADAFCAASFRMTAQTERFQAGSTSINNKQDFVHISDAVRNRPPTATATTAVARAEGMTRASLVNIMGAAVAVSLGIGVSPPIASAARSTEELVSFFVSFAFCIWSRNISSVWGGWTVGPTSTHKKAPA